MAPELCKAMTNFKVTIEVERDVPATKEEAHEVGRILSRYLQNFTYKAKVIKIGYKKNSHP
jgi:hypothetical protein